MNIYIVIRGELEDFAVDSAFTFREMAEARCLYINEDPGLKEPWNKARIEAHKLIGPIQ